MKVNKLYFNSLILSSPGFISIFLSLFAIPIHLSVLGIESFGNYFFFHLILSFSFLLCIGIPKSIVIASGKSFNKKSKIAYEGLKYTAILIIFIYAFHLINEKYALLNFDNLNQNYLTFGMMISVVYLVLEGILQANRRFVFLSINNFIFYSLSLSLPSLILVFFKDLALNDLILISTSIKFFVLLILFSILIKDKSISFSKEKILLITMKKNSFWLTLNSFLVQLYEIFDKYLIKIILGGAALALYSIPQQLTGKLSVLSRGFGVFLMPFLSAGKKKNDYNQTLKIFYCYIPILIFILLPFYSFILNFWLGESFESQILSLTKIFSVIAILSSTSHILITRFEAEQLSKINFKLEITFLPLFIILIGIVFIFFQSLFFISLVILFKELMLNILRIFYLRKKLKKIKIYVVNIFLFVFLLVFSFLNLNIYLMLLLILIYINSKNVFYT